MCSMRRVQAVATCNISRDKSRKIIKVNNVILLLEEYMVNFRSVIKKFKIAIPLLLRRLRTRTMAPMLGSGTKTRSKPYDRHPSQHTKRRSSSKLGAPAQLSQTSRKGKQAWRKNIDVSGIEDALESARLEERTIGSVELGYSRTSSSERLLTGFKWTSIG